MVNQKLLDSARDTMRRKHLSYRTEQAQATYPCKDVLGSFQTKSGKGLLTEPTKESRMILSEVSYYVICCHDLI